MKQETHGLFEYSKSSRTIDKLICPKCEHNKFHESIHGHGHTLHKDMIEKKGFKQQGFGDYSLKCDKCKIKFTYIVQMFVNENIKLQDIPVKEWSKHFSNETKTIIH